MSDSEKLIEAADRASRKRAVIGAVAAGAFLLIQLFAPPFFVAGSEGAGHTRVIAWFINAVVLLAILATGGGLLNQRRMRALVNDEISRVHQRMGMIVGFWVAMACALGLFLIDTDRTIDGREMAYLIVSSTVFVSVVTFSYLEHRAHRDA